MVRRTMWAKALALLVVLPLVAACGGGSSPTNPTPTTYSLTVQVRNEQAGAVSGALVRVTDGANAGRNGTTDATGSAVLANVQLGTFTLEITATGYLDVKQPVTMAASVTENVTLKLTPNTAPQVVVAVKSSLANAPSGYVDFSESATVTATVVDPDAKPDKLSYEWKADSGTFTGTGSTVQWKPSTTTGGSGAASITITCTVTEKYGPNDSLENKATGTVSVVVHDGKKESGDLSTLFLKEFSDSTIPATTVTRNFSGTYCAEGKAEETQQITDNRRDYSITYSAIGPASVNINFDGLCSYRSTPGDACVNQTCEWISRKLSDGTTEHVKGMCYLTTIFDKERDTWRLCWSMFDGAKLPFGSSWRF